MGKRQTPLRTTVTYLEMTAPPKTRYPLPVNIQVALMRTERIPLHFYRYLQHCTGRNYHWVYRLRMDDDALARIVHAPETTIEVLFVAGAPAGFFELSRLPENVVDLVYFGLMPHVHGMGIGKWFLKQALETAWASAPSRVTVNTCTLDHRAALPLYQKLGFVPTGQSETFIHPLTDDECLALVRSN